MSEGTCHIYSCNLHLKKASPCRLFPDDATQKKLKNTAEKLNTTTAFKETSPG